MYSVLGQDFITSVPKRYTYPYVYSDHVHNFFQNMFIYPSLNRESPMLCRRNKFCDIVRFLLKRNFAIRVFKSRGYEQSLKKRLKLAQTPLLIFSLKNNIWKHIFPIFQNIHMFGEFRMVVSNLGIVFFGTLCIYWPTKMRSCSDPACLINFSK